MDNHIYALILAGGQGTRFWPWSTPEKPKQFLPVIGEESLLAQTYHRLQHFIPDGNIYIIADPKYLKAVKEAIPEFPTENYIAEPAPRNTAPALMLANIHLERIDPEARLLVVPADHYIHDIEKFSNQFSAALQQAANPWIITAGIPPSCPHTGYGYICSDPDQTKVVSGVEFLFVSAFKEKPDVATACEYCDSGNYFWNSGMFVYHAGHFRSFLEKYNPYYGEQYLLWEKAWEDQDRLRELFLSVKPDSIDYALMEKVHETLMFRAAFDWNDVGSWSSVYEIHAKDRNNNVIRGRPIVIDTRDSLIFSLEGPPISVIGMNGAAVVQTRNGLLISPMESLQRVKEIADLLS